ncbi:hypothetical protein [Kordia sp.]|uniref:hypothetical protein n=1 Tax=Kordia sp. TaxID=1965332 RepID=UPI003D26CC51
MKINILKARIKRNNLEKNAGHYFVDETSAIINLLKKEGKEVLLGIHRKDGVYTILEKKFVYYSTASGHKDQIQLNKFSDILQSNALKKGKFFSSYKYVKLDNNERVWLKNQATMESLWNTILWLEKVMEYLHLIGHRVKRLNH